MKNRIKKSNYPIPFRGGELSIQADKHAYCIPKSNYGPYSHVEVAFFDEDTGDMILIQELKDRADNPEGKCIVHGYVPVERVKELLKDDGYNDKNIKGIFERINTVVEFK
tara:strand:+ start:22937 stop:23266 length:330 start_codon:yes stop_codon:yes gene_type:complete